MVAVVAFFFARLEFAVATGRYAGLGTICIAAIVTACAANTNLNAFVARFGTIYDTVTANGIPGTGSRITCPVCIISVIVTRITGFTIVLIDMAVTTGRGERTIGFAAAVIALVCEFAIIAFFGAILNAIPAITSPLACFCTQILAIGVFGINIGRAIIAFFVRFILEAITAVIGQCTVALAAAISPDIGSAQITFFFTIQNGTITAIGRVLACSRTVLGTVIEIGCDIVFSIIAFFVRCIRGAITAFACISGAIFLAEVTIGTGAAAHHFSETLVANLAVRNVTVAAIGCPGTILITSCVTAVIIAFAIIAFFVAIDEAIAAPLCFASAISTA